MRDTKYRTADKAFKLNAGARLIPYNIDGIARAEQASSWRANPMRWLPHRRAQRIDQRSGGANKNLTWLDRL